MTRKKMSRKRSSSDASVLAAAAPRSELRARRMPAVAEDVLGESAETDRTQATTTHIGFAQMVKGFLKTIAGLVPPEIELENSLKQKRAKRVYEPDAGAASPARPLASSPRRLNGPMLTPGRHGQLVEKIGLDPLGASSAAGAGATSSQPEITPRKAARRGQLRKYYGLSPIKPEERQARYMAHKGFRGPSG